MRAEIPAELILSSTYNVQALGLIPLLPLIGSLLTFVVGSRIPALAGWIATAASAAAFFVVLGLYLSLDSGASFHFNAFNWFAVENLKVDFSFLFDPLTAVMCLVVTGIGSLIHLYSIGYMAEDASRHRFFAYLNLFLFSMLLLVTGSNLAVLFVGWEGVGLCSYLLIGFWFTNKAYSKAGMKAFVVNRIGDAGFLLALFMLIQQVGSLEFSAIQAKFLAGALSPDFVSLVTLFLFVGAAGKSAQIPLFVWLPDAMAGPTPVSALIHAATMVTAGVYLMTRLNFLFTAAPLTMAVILCIALATALVAGSIALVQNDIKKVLAYSTVSQLGFMFIGAASGAYAAALFHLVTHAFFKACLFLSAGSVIHGCHHEQDMRHLGGLWKKMPYTAFCYAVSTLAIAGIAPFAGYYSKHAIIAALEHLHNPHLVGLSEIMGILAQVGAFITAFYMARSFALTFLGHYRGHHHPHEVPWIMRAPVLALAGLSIAGGYFLSHELPSYVSFIIPVEMAHEPESILESILHSWLGALGIVSGLLAFTVLKNIPKFTAAIFAPITTVLRGKYYLDEIYEALIIAPLALLSRILAFFFDRYIIDGAVNGTAALVEVSGEGLRYSETGQMRHYALFMFIGAIFILAFYLVA